jgi:hypothetical protein
MKSEKFLLAQNMAFLIAIPPDSNLAKLLHFCLSTKARSKSSNVPQTEILTIVRELMDKPSDLAYWTQKIMGLDLDYSSEEWKSLGEMGITNSAEFMTQLWAELEGLDL